MDLVHFLEERGTAYRVQQEPPCIEVLARDAVLTLCWDAEAGRLYAVRGGDDEQRASLRLSIPISASGWVTEKAVLRLIAAVIPA